MSRYVEGTVRAKGGAAPLPGLAVEIHALADGAAKSDPLEGARLLGTGRTGPDGRFSVALEDAVDGTTDRRRIVVAVFADDGGANDASKPLAISRPRLEPLEGRDDILVQIPDTVLDDHDVKPPRPPVVTPPKSQGQIAARRLQLASSARRSVQEATSAEIARRIDLRRRGTDLGRRLLVKKGRARVDKRRSYVPPGQKADELLDRARAEGISRLESVRLPGRTIRLDASEARALFPDGPTAEPMPIPDDLLDRLDDLFPTTGGTSRLADLLTACRAEHVARALGRANGHVAHGPTAPPDEPSTPTSELVLTNGNGHAGLLDQLADLLVSMPGAELQPRPGVDAIGQELATNVPPGPADTTAYYDFHRLQVAWEDTWTSAMDGMTLGAISDLYESLVDTVDPAVIKVDDSEIDELEDLLEAVADTVAVASGIPGLDAPAEMVTWMPSLAGVWTSLSPDDQEWLRFLQWIDTYIYPWSLLPYVSGTVADLFDGEIEWPEDWLEAVSLDDLEDDPDWGLHQAEEFLEGLDLDDAPPPPSGLARLERVLGELNGRLAEPHQFDIFVPNSYNFGVLTTYRQRWQPLEYQAGDLVASMPLAPGESRSFETKRVVKTSRTQKEIEHSIASRTGESTTTGRVEAEVVQKASHATNFAMTAEGSVAIAIVEAGGSTTFGANQSADSADTKRDLRESTVRAAQEYRDERTLEVATEDSITGETVEKRSITNPNNELTVTYLLYELQRRFEVAERLHAIQPVVLVAFDVPSPDEIDEGWLIANSWILRRVILDDRLLPALDYLSDSFAGDELGVEILRAQWDAHMRAVDALRDNVETSAAVRNVARSALVAAASTVAGRDGLFLNIGEALFPSKADEDEVITAQRESSQQALEWADSDLLAQRTRLETGVSALQQATDAYVQALTRRTNRRVAIDQLRVHVKENILHYMQAIWSHEPTDQRYFRLYDLPIQWPETDRGGMSVLLDPSVHWSDLDTVPRTARSASATGTTQDPQPLAPGSTAPDPPSSVNWWTPAVSAEVFVPPPRLGPERRLHEVADVDSLLGFKGNYAMFPLREGNAITDYMAQAFLDSYFGVIDPDPFGEVPTTYQAVALAECAWNRPETTDEDRAEITQWVLDVMAAQERISQEIVVPTGQLFMEALPGAHPLLEDFKLQHRVLDVERAVADVKIRNVELLRRAARLVNGDLADPDIEQRIDVSGTSPTISIDGPPPVVEPA